MLMRKINLPRRRYTWPPRMVACSRYSVLVNELGADINATDEINKTPLHLAAERSHTNTVCELVKELGSKVNAVNQSGKTPLLLGKGPRKHGARSC